MVESSARFALSGDLSVSLSSVKGGAPAEDTDCMLDCATIGLCSTIEMARGCVIS